MARDRAGWRNHHRQPNELNTVEGAVLVVEADAALRRVIALGLRGRGLAVLEAQTLGDIWERITTPPAAIVLDVGLGAASEWMLLRALGGHHALRAAPLVLLAWDCPAALDPAPPGHGGQQRERVCLTKPFDARALFAAVERLVAAPELSVAATAASADLPAQNTVALEESHGMRAGESAATPGASLWPLMAAGAATLAVAGFLIHPALAVVGIVLLIAAVLWWSTSTEPATPA